MSQAGRLLASAKFLGRLQSEISIRNSDELDSCSPTAAAMKEEGRAKAPSDQHIVSMPLQTLDPARAHPAQRCLLLVFGS